METNSVDLEKPQLFILILIQFLLLFLSFFEVYKLISNSHTLNEVYRKEKI